jgi:hypothetical protein
MRRIRIMLLCLMLTFATAVSAAVAGDPSLGAQTSVNLSAPSGTLQPDPRTAVNQCFSDGPTGTSPRLSLLEDLLPPRLEHWIRWAKEGWAALSHWLEQMGLWTF